MGRIFVPSSLFARWSNDIFLQTTKPELITLPPIVHFVFQSPAACAYIQSARHLVHPYIHPKSHSSPPHDDKAHREQMDSAEEPAQ
jgi:hypothetical protein